MFVNIAKIGFRRDPPCSRRNLSSKPDLGNGIGCGLLFSLYSIWNSPLIWKKNITMGAKQDRLICLWIIWHGNLSDFLSCPFFKASWLEQAPLWMLPPELSSTKGLEYERRRNKLEKRRQLSKTDFGCHHVLRSFGLSGIKQCKLFINTQFFFSCNL